MDPQKNTQQPADQNATNWNDETPKTDGAPAGTTPQDGAAVPTGMPPAPTESTVGGPEAPSITSEPTTGTDNGAGGSTSDQGINNEAPMGGTSVPPMGPADGSGMPPADDQTPVTPADSGQPLTPSEPAAHHPSSVMLMLVVLGAVVVAVLGFFVIPALF